MNIEATKIELIQYVLNTQKESLLLKIKELVLSENDEVIGSTVKGEPMTIASLNAKLDRAEEDYIKGRITTDKELDKEIETW